MNDKIYGDLLVAALPKKIETEEENERVLEIIKSLMRKGEQQISPEERALLNLLVMLVEDFEGKAYSIAVETDPLKVMLFLMEQNELKQADMIDVFGSGDRVAEVINGKRAISKNQAGSLAAKFNVPADLFT